MRNGDFFSVYGDNVSPSPNSSRIETRLGNLSSDNIYVYDCEFIECFSSTSEGGAMRVSSSDSTKMLIEKTTFYRCKTTGYKCGAVSFGSKGSCVLSKICGIGCCTTTNHGLQFAYILCTNSKVYKNNLNDSTISRSINNYDTYNSFVSSYGSIVHINNNFSFNKCRFQACCALSPSPYTTLSCSYNTDSNNTAIDNRIIALVNYGNLKIISCNIIQNFASTTSGGIIWTNRNLLIKDSCIIENSAKYTLYEDERQYKITVENCTLDENVESKTKGSVSITNKAKVCLFILLFIFQQDIVKSKRKGEIFFKREMYFGK